MSKTIAGWIVFLCSLPLFAIGIAIVMLLEYGEALVESIQRRSIKYLFWRMNWAEKCPYCGGETIRHGFYPNERYTCSKEDCKFNDTGLI